MSYVYKYTTDEMKIRLQDCLLTSFRLDSRQVHRHTEELPVKELDPKALEALRQVTVQVTSPTAFVLLSTHTPLSPEEARVMARAWEQMARSYPDVHEQAAKVPD